MNPSRKTQLELETKLFHERMDAKIARHKKQIQYLEAAIIAAFSLAIISVWLLAYDMYSLLP